MYTYIYIYVCIEIQPFWIDFVFFLPPALSFCGLILGAHQLERMFAFWMDPLSFLEG